MIDIIEALDLNLNLGNALKYLARVGRKDGEPVMTALLKAEYYVQREIRCQIEGAVSTTPNDPDLARCLDGVLQKVAGEIAREHGDITPAAAAKYLRGRFASVDREAVIEELELFDTGDAIAAVEEIEAETESEAVDD